MTNDTRPTCPICIGLGCGDCCGTGLTPMTVCPRCDMLSDLCICKDETDQAPEARLAAALLAALKASGYRLTHEYSDGGVLDVAPAILAADPTIAADLVLAAAVRERFPNTTRYIEESLSDD